jgi:hypothetical protein
VAELKTKKNDDDVEAFIAGIADERKREDSAALLGLMQRITGQKPKMWGSAIIGFGDHHYKYESGREGDWFNVGFSPRKQSLTLYLTDDIEKSAPLLENLGKFTTGKGCLYVKRLEDVDAGVLEELIKQSYDART